MTARRVALLTVCFAAAVSAAGGVGYAASGISHAVRGVASPRAAHGTTAGGDQYRPGFGFGDENHNHEGPPGLAPRTRTDGTPVEPETRRTSDGRARIVSTTVVVDEQAALRIAIVDASGAPLLLTQRGSRLGATQLSGKQSKTLRYTVLVPRPVQLVLRVPANLLAPGATYRIRVIATDPDGNRSTAYLPFTP